ncbi:hypothetical protein LJC17_00060 [Acholeplasma sp. OttesenSCG-928-E16]|nr:hypothetical protein [Acholeplasma sp. OttesenSCG-928-E16]
MKKIILLIMVLLSLTAFSNTFHGQEDDINMSNSYPISINYLDLQYIKQSSKLGSSKFSIPIKVKNGVEYVIITSDNFVGERNGEYIDLIEYEIVEVNNKKNNKVSFEVAEKNGTIVYYTSFTARDSLINIVDFPTKESKLGELMLMEGNINDFEKFVPYVGPREGTEFDGVVYCAPNKKLDLDQLATSIKNNNQEILEIKKKQDRYSERYQEVGSHDVVYHFVYSKNIVVYNLEIRVMDLDAPSIVGPTVLNFSISDNVTDEAILSNFQFNDNVTDSDLLVKEVVYNEYINHKGERGSYEAKIKVTDEFDNETEQIIVVRVGQTFSAVAEGPSKIFLYTDQDPLTDADIFNRYTLSEGIDASKVTMTIMNNNYLGNKRPGTYQMTVRFEYKETANTRITTNIGLVIVVVDREIPSLNIPEMILNLEEANRMTNSEIKDYIASELLRKLPAASNIELLLNEYEASEGAGTYFVYYRFNLEEKTYSNRLMINVIEKENGFNPLFIVIPSIVFVSLGIIVFIILKRKFDSKTKK